MARIIVGKNETVVNITQTGLLVSAALSSMYALAYSCFQYIKGFESLKVFNENKNKIMKSLIAINQEMVDIMHNIEVAHKDCKSYFETLSVFSEEEVAAFPDFNINRQSCDSFRERSARLEDKTAIDLDGKKMLDEIKKRQNIIKASLAKINEYWLSEAYYTYKYNLEQDMASIKENVGEIVNLALSLYNKEDESEQ